MKTKFYNIPKEKRIDFRIRALETMATLKREILDTLKSKEYNRLGKLSVRDDGKFVYHYNLKTWIEIELDVTKRHGLNILLWECFDDNTCVSLNISHEHWAVDLFNVLTKS